MSYRKLNSLLNTDFKKTDYIFFTIINDRKILPLALHLTIKKKKMTLKPSSLHLHRTEKNFQQFLF